MPVTDIRFGSFNPDASDRNNLSLDTAENVLPLFQTYTSLPGLSVLTEGPAINAPISGGISHLFSSSGVVQYGRLYEDVQSGGFQKVDGVNTGTTDLFEALDESRPNTVDYITSATGGNPYIGKITAVDDPGATTDVKYRYLYRIRDESGTISGDFNVDLWDPGFGTIHTDSVTVTGATDGWVLQEPGLSSFEEGNITDYSTLQFRVYTNASGAQATKVPDETIGNSGNWEGDDGGADIHNYVDDAGDDADYMVTPTMPAGGTNFWCTLGLPDVLDPEDSDDHTVRVRAKKTASNCDLVVRLKEGDTVIKSSTITLTSSFATTDINLSTSEADSIEDYDNLKIVVQAKNTGSVSATVQVSAVQFLVPNQDSLDIAWIELEVPSADTIIAGDILKQYVGFPEKIYEIDTQDQWSDVSRAADYQQGTDLAKSWSFVSWGSDVYANNYVDEMQTKAPSDTLFSNAISSPGADEYEPRARFNAVINNFLVLADINPNSGGLGGSGTIGATIGNEYTVAWSAINNPLSFKQIDLTTQSGYQPLLDTPGHITGVVGGVRWGLIFKRNSIYRMSYVGPDLIFTFDVISRNQGCPYPRSIVQVDNDVYFMSNSGPFVVREGSYLEPIGHGAVTRYLMEADYSDDAIFTQGSDDSRDTDSVVLGAFDCLTRTIWWVYLPVTASAFYETPNILVYGVDEQRFATATSTSSTRPSIAHIHSLNNTIRGGSSLLRQLQFFMWDLDQVETTYGLYALISPETETSTLRTQIITAADITQTPNYTGDIMVTEVAPVFSTVAGITSHPPYPKITVTVSASDDPEVRDDVASSTAVSDDRNRNGLYPLSTAVAGGYFYFEFSFQALRRGHLRQLTGYRVKWQPVGDEL